MHEKDTACVQYAHENAISDFKEFTQEEWPHRWEKQNITYSVIRGTDDIAGDERLAVNLAMTTWDVEIKNSLLWIPRDVNADITVEFRDRENDEFFKSRPSVLAYAYFPKTSKEGEIVFNDHYHWGMKEGIVNITNPDGTVSRVKQYNIIHTLIHEIGHSLGLRHSEGSLHPRTVMHWQYNRQLNLQEYDKMRLLQKYEKRGWLKGRYARISRWLALRKVRF